METRLMAWRTNDIHKFINLNKIQTTDIVSFGIVSLLLNNFHEIHSHIQENDNLNMTKTDEITKYGIN